VNLKNRFLLTNLSLLVIPPVIMLALTFLAYTVLAAISGSGLQYDHFEKALSTRAGLFSAASQIWRQSPEAAAKEEFAQYLAARFDDLTVAVVVVRDGAILHASGSISPDTPGLAEALSESAAPGQAVIGEKHYARYSNRLNFQDGKTGFVYLLIPTDRQVEQAGYLAMFALAVLFLVSLITQLYATSRTVRTIATPLVRLNSAVSAMSEGDLKEPIVEQGDEEIRQLYRTMELLRLKLLEALAQRARVDENRQMLVTSISHDLKTPITSIVGHIEGLKDGIANTPDKQRNYLETIRRKAAQLDKMIDDLVLYSRLDLDQLPYQFVRTDLIAWLGEVLDEARETFAQANMTLHWSDTLSSDCTVWLDHSQMRRVFANLFDNARKYRQGDQGEVTVTVRDRQDQVIIDIADSGIGIPPDSLPYLFDRFYRVDSARNQAEGSGLGLAIARQIVTGHQGQIWVRNREGQGTVFSIALPKEDPRHDKNPDH
jgi:signal transduction histidine kinase